MALAACTVLAQPPPQATDGVLDLTAWQFERDGPVSLVGEWAFYWQRLLTAEEIKAGAAPSQIVELPDWWNGYQIAGKTLGGRGYATYYLRVNLGAPPPRLALKIPEFETAYRFYVNGELVAQNGRVGVTPTETTPAWRPLVVDCSSGQTLNLILQIANFDHRRGGAGQVIKLGTESQIRALRERALFLVFLLIGGLVMIGLYHLGIYVLRSQETSALFFGLICLLMAMRSMTTGEYYLSQFWPTLGWQWLVRFTYLSFAITVPLFASFARELFPDEIPRWLPRILALCAALYTLLTIFTPAYIFTRALPYQVVSVGAAIYVLIQVARAVRHRRSGARTFLVGFFILAGAMVNDILHNNQVIHTAFIGPVGIFSFIFFQAYLLARRFTGAFSEVERLSRDLERRVAQRTRELILRNKELLDVNTELLQEIERREQAEVALWEAKEEAERANRAKSVFLANMSHELRTPLNAVLGFSELLTQDPNLTAMQRGHLKTIGRSGEHLLTLLNEVLTLSRIEAGKTEVQPEIFGLREMLRRLEEMFHLQAEQHGLALRFEIDEDIPHYVRADAGKLRQVLINLLGNAVKFTEEGVITMRVRQSEGGDIG